ncbi:MAG: Flp pilus assembly complex ATPase component TadA [Actinobacteria bacterium]|nr:Flp pilus assembly complex ATPase component TadA [Actinomycetota bacterium]
MAEGNGQGPNVSELLWELVQGAVADEQLEPARDSARVGELAAQVVTQYGREAAVGAVLPLGDPPVMVERLVRLVCDYGPLTEALRPGSGVEEIFIEDERVFLVVDGRLRGLVEPTSAAMNRHIVDKLLGDTNVALDATTPHVQAQVLGGRARLTAVGPPLIDDGGVSACIRLYAVHRATLDDLLRWGSSTKAANNYISLLMRLPASVVLSGPPAAGKTTSFSAVLSAIPENFNVRLAEDYPELPRPVFGRAYRTRPADAEGRGAVTLRELVRMILGLSPRFIGVGEVRGAESFELARGLHAGTGFGVTVHSHSAPDALDALVMTALGAGPNVNERMVRMAFAKRIDAIIHVDRDDPNQLADDDPFRRQITEIHAMDPQLRDDEFSTHAVFERPDGLGSPLVYTGKPPGPELTRRLERLLPPGRRLVQILTGRAGLS